MKKPKKVAPKKPKSAFAKKYEVVSAKVNVDLRHKPQVDDSPHIIVVARAGSGKTTTLIEGLKRVKDLASKLTPSPQQADVWDAMQASSAATAICFAAFNKSIAKELQGRVPQGCEAMTLHSFGFKSVLSAFGRVEVQEHRVQDIISEILDIDIRELRYNRIELLQATEKLVGLCKSNLIGLDARATGGIVCGDIDDDDLDELAAQYDVELNGSRDECFELVPLVLERCRDVARDRGIDFNDMIWLPIALDLPIRRYDLMLVDEAQDLNRCQQALAKEAGKRLILCGDPKQAIYGFAGADSQSMPRMFTELSGTPRGCIELRLTVTRRCGKAIVAEAKRLVPGLDDFEAHELNPEGKISYAIYEPPNEADSYRKLVEDGDMVLCRVNAPLVRQWFKFITSGRKARIQGRDIGAGLITTIKKLKAKDGPDLTTKLSDWFHRETKKETAKRNPNENKLILLQDRYDCLCCFIEDQPTVQAVIDKIDAVFTDDRQVKGILLSSIHKAKGLEADRVFLLQPTGAKMPHSMARTEAAREQEFNLLYVGITRAIHELVHVA